MEYWALINDVKVGPLPPEKLMALGMGRDTLVWREGMAEWTAAWRLPELDYCFRRDSRQMMDSRPCPPTYLAWAIISTILCCPAFGIVSIIYAASVESKYNRGDYEGAQKASQNAMMWLIVAVVSAFALTGLQFFFQLFTFFL